MGGWKGKGNFYHEEVEDDGNASMALALMQLLKVEMPPDKKRLQEQGRTLLNLVQGKGKGKGKGAPRSGELSALIEDACVAVLETADFDFRARRFLHEMLVRAGDDGTERVANALKRCAEVAATK